MRSFFFFLTMLVCMTSMSLVVSEDSQTEGSVDADAGKTTEEATKVDEAPKKAKKEKDDSFDPDNEDWGTYYDPQNVFCGKHDCYKILGFDYESYDKVKPTTKEITQRYRKLSRVWHPDKSKHRNAKERFVHIARAYEILTSKDQRKEYDDLRYDQEAYFNKYGTSVLWSYAPKSDVTIVLIIILVIGNIFSWYSQKHRWQLVADRLIQAAVEDWTPRDGGTEESKELREHALQILADREESVGESSEQTTVNSNSSSAKVSSKKKGGNKKVSGKEKKKQEQEALLPIITELVNEMDDFGSGFHKPTWRDLLIVSLAKMPHTFVVGFAWQSKYWIRRLQKKELNDEEKEVLTARAVGPVIWNHATEEERQDMIQRELWVTDNLAEWNEEQEIKKLSAAEQKYINKLKKKGKLDKLE